MTIYRQHIPSTDSRLGRHIHHDERSKAYAYPTAGLTLTSARHARRIEVLDQGQLGSCTGNAGIGCLGTEPFYDTLLPSVALVVEVDGQRHLGRSRTLPRYTFDEAGAVLLYCDATRLDDAPGSYPPDDTGSDGLSVAKALKSAGEISGYQHTFTLNDALLALGQTPVITGVAWHEDMFNPDPDGRLRITGAVAGGHEFVIDEIDVESQQVWMTNSWGASWGIGGRAYLTFADWGSLLADQGDVTIFTPLTSPAPTPSPTPPADPDQVLAVEAHRYIAYHHTSIAENRQMAAALRVWLAAKGL